MPDLEADQFVCTRCGRVGEEHDLDGMGECRECAERMMTASDFGSCARWRSSRFSITAIMGREPLDIHTWFSLTYANYLVLPRSVLQSMPEEWQHRFTALLGEMESAYGHLDWPDYAVQARGSDGRFMADPIPHYNRGRTRIEPHQNGSSDDA